MALRYLAAHEGVRKLRDAMREEHILVLDFVSTIFKHVSLCRVEHGACRRRERGGRRSCRRAGGREGGRAAGALLGLAGRPLEADSGWPPEWSGSAGHVGASAGMWPGRERRRELPRPLLLPLEERTPPPLPLAHAQSALSAPRPPAPLRCRC